MVVRLLSLSVLLWLLAGCRQDQLLTVAQAAGSEPAPSSGAALRQAAMPAPAQPRRPQLKVDDSCYTFIRLRPRSQRAEAVQARLEQADKLSAALDERTISVDLIGDHVNILSLAFPVQWPADPSYAHRVSEIVERYFSDPDVQDDLCNSGFAEIRLSARGRNDHRMHPLWSARVTSEGLLRLASTGEELVTADFSFPPGGQP